MFAVQHLIERDDLTRVRGHAAHGSNQAGLRTPLDLVVGPVLADRGDEVVPFQLLRILFRLRKRPAQIFVRQVDRVLRGQDTRDFLAVVDPHLPGMVGPRRDDGRALGAMRIAGEFIVHAGHVAPFIVELGSVGIGVLDRIGVEVLIEGIATIVAATDRHGLHGPSILHPGALVDLVDVVIGEHPAAQPQESVELGYLIHQLRDTLGLGRGRAAP